MSDHGKRQPAGGQRANWLRKTGQSDMETVAFANRRKKSRVRNQQAKASRKRNRG
jgi:hypothetical protein